MMSREGQFLTRYAKIKQAFETETRAARRECYEAGEALQPAVVVSAFVGDGADDGASLARRRLNAAVRAAVARHDAARSAARAELGLV